MALDAPIKALLIAVSDDPRPVVFILQRLIPDHVCFVMPASSQQLVETQVHTRLDTMPQKWDWIIPADTESFPDCHKALAGSLPLLLRTWNIHAGDLVMEVSCATPAMAAAMSLAAFPFTTQIVTVRANAEPAGEGSGEGWRLHAPSNPWDDEAPSLRQEGVVYFNKGAFSASAGVFRRIEARVSGSLKPLYRAFADLSAGYQHWDVFAYRAAWEKLKGAVKALDLAAAWGGPPGVSSLVSAVKANIRFLEEIVLDPAEVKGAIIRDLLAHARRRIDQHQDAEVAARVMVRALEACAQRHLFQAYHIKSWDVPIDRLQGDLRSDCERCCVSEVDGKYHLPLHGQFRALADLGDPVGEAFFKQWPKMKSLIDAMDRAVLGHGFDPVKTERCRQLFDLVLTLCELQERDLPTLPTMS